MQPPGIHVVRHHHEAAGPPVVLVHGSPERGKNFAHVVHLLGDLPITVYDRRGYGRSLAAGEDGGGLSVHADDLIALLDGTPSVVVGQSAGGVVALLAATRAPELFLAVGVWEPPMTPYDWWPTDRMLQTAAWAAAPDPEVLGEQFNRMVLGDARWEQLPERTRQLLRAEGRAFRDDMRSQAEPYFELHQLTVPRVVGCGVSERDPVGLAVHRLTAERTGSQLLVVEDADHNANLSNPAAWARLARAAVDLASTSAAGGAR